MHFSTIAATMAIAATTVSGAACPVPPQPAEPVTVFDPVFPTPSASPEPVTEQPVGSETSSCIDGVGISWQPEVYDISPANPDRTSSASTTFNVYNLSNDVKNQVIVFRNIPASAKNCRIDYLLSWPRKEFFTTKNHNVQLYGLTEIPETFSASTIEPLLNTTESAGIVWNGDENLEKGVGGSAGFPPCSGEIAYIASLNYENGGEGSLLMGQDKKNGFMLKYNC